MTSFTQSRLANQPETLAQIPISLTLAIAQAIVRNETDPQRAAKVGTVVDRLRTTIGEHGFFNPAHHGIPLDTPVARWNDEAPDELAWFSLIGIEGYDIPQETLADVPRHEWAGRVAMARLNIMGEDEEGRLDGTSFTVIMPGHDPANYDVIDGVGFALSPAELDGVMEDLQTYSTAVADGRLE